MTAEDLGKRLLVEIEEIGLDEVLDCLRLKEEEAQSTLFGLPTFDRIITSATQARMTLARTQPSMPIVELMSLYPGSGKTHLLYSLTAIAVLPKYSGGRQTAVVVLDTHCKFSVPRLAQQMMMIAEPHFKVEDERITLGDMIVESLKHVHIFHPQSICSAVASIHALQGYLFDSGKHYSFNRSVGFVALDSAAAFYWQARAGTEDSASRMSNSGMKPTQQPSGYIQLAAAIQNCSRTFRCPILYTTIHHGSLKQASSFDTDGRSFRPSLPSPWQILPTVRLVLRRVLVRKLPAETDVEEALRETQLRQKVVEQGRFECSVNEWGLDERTLQKLHQEDTGFGFTIKHDGISFAVTAPD